MTHRSVKIGVVGLGTVGAGLIKALRKSRRIVRERCGVEVVLAMAAELDSRRARASGLPPGRVTSDYRRIIEDPAIHVVVELIGGTEVARDVVLGALRAGKHVVTANKALLAKHWRRIFSMANRRRCAVGFEASVMAGVPVIRTLEEGLSGNSVRSLTGILNGTSNFILTRMANRGMEFDRALREARRRGLCEADASLDVDGCDAAQKLAILGSIALGKWLSPAAVHREGIGHIERFDLAEARQEYGYVLRPLAILKRGAQGVEARVHPTFVPTSHPLAGIKDEFNAVLINADTAGPVTLSGKGAGEKPAASGVLSDVIDVVRTVAQEGASSALVRPVPAPDRLRVMPMQDVETKYYLRFSVVDRPGVLSFIAGALGRGNVSIARCHQRGRSERGSVPLFVITHQAREGAVRKALREIDSARSVVKRKTVLIRIEE